MDNSEYLYHRQCRRGRKDLVEKRVERCGLEPTSSLGRMGERAPLLPVTHRTWWSRVKDSDWGSYEHYEKTDPKELLVTHDKCEASYRAKERELRRARFYPEADDQYLDDYNTVMISKNVPYVIPQELLEKFNWRTRQWEKVPTVAHPSVNCRRDKWDLMNQSHARSFKAMGLDPDSWADVREYYRQKHGKSFSDNDGNIIEWVDDWFDRHDTKGSAKKRFVSVKAKLTRFLMREQLSKTIGKKYSELPLKQQHKVDEIIKDSEKGIRDIILDDIEICFKKNNLTKRNFTYVGLTMAEDQINYTFEIKTPQKFTSLKPEINRCLTAINRADYIKIHKIE